MLTVNTSSLQATVEGACVKQVNWPAYVFDGLRDPSGDISNFLRRLHFNECTICTLENPVVKNVGVSSDKTVLR